MPRIIKRIITIISALLGIALFLGLSLAGIALYLNSPAAIPGQGESVGTQTDGIRIEGGTAFIEVRKGENAQSVGRRLAQAGLIRSPHFWYLLCRFSADFLKTGSYQLEVPASQVSIHSALVSGKQILRRVTVPEGVTLKKTARILEEAGICAADEFLAAASGSEMTSRYSIPNATMEGYLFPDTYFFPAEYPAARAVEAMADNFFKQIREIEIEAAALSNDADSPLRADPSRFSIAELNRRVIVASIVEREYRVPEEAPVMAGVFYNRMGIGMALQSCATVEYVITEVQGRPHPEILSTRDTEIRNPYNTYTQPGLPPGPICSPGAIALKAAFNPVESDYLYFRLVNPESGKHYFSRTLDDHIRAGILYVKSR